MRELMRLHGVEAAASMLGNVNARTLSKAASEQPIARLTATVIRAALERLR